MTSTAWLFFEKHLYHSDKDKRFQKIRAMSYSIGDQLKMEFDFISKEVKLYHNGIEKDSQVLTVTKLWIGLSLALMGANVKMIDYQYNYK